MIKFKHIIILSCIIGRLIIGQEINYKEEMSEVIKGIRNNTPKDFILIQQNAVDLYFEEDFFRRDWLSRIDGISQESLYYGDPEYNDKTPREYNKFLVDSLSQIKGEGKTIFTTNYTNSFWSMKRSKRKSNKKGFINYNVPNLEASIINMKIPDENNQDINKLSDVKNILYLLNPEKYKKKEDLLKALENSNFDLIIIDAFFHEKLLKKKDIERISYKQNKGKRLVIAYFSIGEAEDNRYYWKKKWNDETPNWIIKENENWKGNYIVEYWNPKWKNILSEYSDSIVESGFDGVFLDTVDTYDSFIYGNE